VKARSQGSIAKVKAGPGPMGVRVKARSQGSIANYKNSIELTG